MLGFRTGFSSRGRGSAAAALDLRFAGGTKAAAAVAPPMPSPDASVLALRFFAIGWTPGDPPAAGVPSYSAVRRDPCRPPPRRPARAPFVPARPPGAPPRQRQRRTLFLGVRQRNGEVSSLTEPQAEVSNCPAGRSQFGGAIPSRKVTTTSLAPAAAGAGAAEAMWSRMALRRRTWSLISFRAVFVLAARCVAAAAAGGARALGSTAAAQRWPLRPVWPGAPWWAAQRRRAEPRSRGK